jgi:hypothetical protein
MISKQFVTAGRAVFTVEVPAAFAEQHKTQPHYTYKVRFKKGDQQYRDAWFVMMLTGPDNTSDYTYVGMMQEDGSVKLTGKSKFTADSIPVSMFSKVVRRVFTGDTKPIEDAGFKVHHVGQCGRCGRDLTVPESIESGIGPECARQMGCAPAKRAKAVPAPQPESESVKVEPVRTKTKKVKVKMDRNPHEMTVGKATQPGEVLVVEASERPDIDTSRLIPRVEQGEVVGWSGVWDGRNVLVLND